jgi:hypothetical protein
MASHSRGRFTHCIDCGEPPTSSAPLSKRGLHEACARERMMKSAAQMAAKEGPYYEQWRRSVIDHARQVANG